jgi:hypothetical protein
MEATKIEIANENNKLNCNAFVTIDLEPGNWPESKFNRTYCICVDGEDRLYKLVDFIRLPFADIGSAFTIPAAGMTSFAWKRKYKRDHQNTTNETKMAVYFFKRHE